VIIVGAAISAAPSVKGDAINKTTCIMLVAGLVLVGSSMATFFAEPAIPPQTRTIKAGRATLRIPLNLPKEITSGTTVSGCAILGVKDDCDITYDQFLGIYWSDRPVPGTGILPTKAYKKVSEFADTELNLGKRRQARVLDIRLSAKKPCGRMVEEKQRVIELYCADSKIHIVIAGMLDPVITKEKVTEIAESLQCP